MLHVLCMPTPKELEHDDGYDGSPINFDTDEVCVPHALDGSTDFTLGRLFTPFPGYAYLGQREEGKRVREEIIMAAPVGRLLEYRGRKFVVVTIGS